MNKKASAQVSIYKIDKSMFDDIKNSSEIIDKIVSEYNSKRTLENEKYKEQGLRDAAAIEGFLLKTYYAKKSKVPRWKRFFEPILEESADLIKAENSEASFVAFLYNENHLFAITGGQGNFLVQNYIDISFGIDIISRLITQSSKVIKALDERGLTGSILASRKYYRFNYKLIDEDEFGKLYKQVTADLDKDILVNSLGFSNEETKRGVGCVAKSTLKLNKSIDINFLAKLLKKISEVMDHDPNFKMNKVEAISRRQNKQKTLIKELDDLVYKQINEQIRKGDFELKIDICHPEFEKFLEASYYKLFSEGHKNPAFKEKIEEIKDMRFLFNAIDRQEGLDKTDEKSVCDFIKNLKIRSYDEAENLLTEGALIRHLTGEFLHKEKLYFIIDGEWYKIQSDFISRMNTESKNVITNCLDNSILQEAWDEEVIEDENNYNQLYFDKEGFIVLDTVTSENIELCDIIKYDKDNLYLIHVKQGFGNTMRDLTSQITISARRVLEAKLSTKYDFLSTYYKSLLKREESESDYSKKLHKQTENITEEKFLELFKTKKPIYCLAFIDKRDSDRSIEDIEKFRSNIAKYSIIELNRKLKSIDIELKIVQIKKINPVNNIINMGFKTPLIG